MSWTISVWGQPVTWTGTHWASSNRILAEFLEQVTEQILHEEPDQPLPPPEKVAQLVIKRIRQVAGPVEPSTDP